MKKFLLTEQEKIEILNSYLINEEEYINKTHDKAYDYKFSNGKYYYSIKNKDRWVLAEPGSTAERAIKTKVIFNPSTTATPCQAITPNSQIKDLSQIVNSVKSKYPNINPYKIINGFMAKYSKTYQAQGIPQRICCELALIKLRPGYKNKNVFVLDTALKQLYLYDKTGKFIAKTTVISGGDKQKTDPKAIAQALISWEDEAKQVGFEFDYSKGEYIDKTGKGRKYDPELVYAHTKKTGSRFLPKDIYTTTSLSSDDEYAGKENNVLSLKTSGGDIISQAIHGYYIEKPRTEALKKAKEFMSRPNDPKISQELMDLVLGGKANLSQSYGCINVPPNFLEYLRKYGENSYVFNMGEDKQNYLVDNTPNFFDKMINSQGCPSPRSLGATPISDIQSFA